MTSTVFALTTSYLSGYGTTVLFSIVFLTDVIVAKGRYGGTSTKTDNGAVQLLILSSGEFLSFQLFLSTQLRNTPFKSFLVGARNKHKWRFRRWLGVELALFKWGKPPPKKKKKKKNQPLKQNTRAAEPWELGEWGKVSMFWSDRYSYTSLDSLARQDDVQQGEQIA